MKFQAAPIVRATLTTAAAITAIVAVGCLAYAHQAFKAAEEGIPGPKAQRHAIIVDESEISFEPETGRVLQRVSSM
ncbi:MAG: hypothetical protein JNJ48_05720 [Phycisphaerae bacterium]|nr:hypothetical protein [Phycisphaerae bacterium]